MSGYKLKMMSSFREYSSITLELEEKSTLSIGYGYDINKDRFVFSDRKYRAELEGEGIEDIEHIDFLVNGFPVSQTIKNGQIEFNDTRFQRTQIFMDNFGYIQIGIIFSRDGVQKELYSKYISVLVRKGLISESVQRMAAFVYKHQEPFLRDDRMTSQNTNGLKEDTPQILDSKIKTLYGILKAYEVNYPFFRTSSKFRVHLEGELVDFEKAQYFDSATVQSIARNPMYLVPTMVNSGIQVQKTHYVPTKVYSKTSRIDYDIYENRVIVGFLASLEKEVISLISDIRQRIDSIPSENEIAGGYFASACFIYDVTKRQLEEYLKLLKAASEKLSQMYVLYWKLFEVSAMSVTQTPRPSAILLSIHHYRSIYDKICEWFRYGIYDFAKEDFMLPFLQMHKLYEYYVLTKLCWYFENHGYELKTRESYPYKGHAKVSAVKNFNTFYFIKDEIEVTLYYEPIINGKKNLGDNGLGLCRNTSIAFPKQFQIDKILNEDSSGPQGFFYCPDYVIKIQRSNSAEYIIMDAKFSMLSVVKGAYLPCLAYKYLFSLSPLQEKDRLVGLCLINGKSLEADDTVYNAYDLAENLYRIKPFAKILTLTENLTDNEDLHQKLLSEIMPS